MRLLPAMAGPTCRQRCWCRRHAALRAAGWRSIYARKASPFGPFTRWAEIGEMLLKD